MARYQHTDDTHNSGVVWGRVSRVHPALLQHMEVTVSVAMEWNSSQLPIPTTRKSAGRSPRIASGHGARRLAGTGTLKVRALRVCVCVCVVSFSVNRTVRSLMGEVFQLLGLAPSTCERYVLKLCDSEEHLQK